MLLLLLLTSNVAFAQSLQERLAGSWVCHEIIDLKGNPVGGKYCNSGMYLKFIFMKNIMWTTTIPFEITSIGSPYRVNKKDSLVNFMGDRNKTLVDGEGNYKIKYLSDNHLILQGLNSESDTINYILLNSYRNSCERADSSLVDNGLILIKHLKLPGADRNMANRVYDYYTEMTPSLLGDAPYFNDNKTHSLGHYISNRFVFPEDFRLDSISPVLTIDFYVSEEGVNDLRVIKGISEDIDSQVIRILNECRSKWIIPHCNDHALTIRNRLNFIFYYAELDTSGQPFIFK